MNLVVDASVVAKWLFEEADSDRAEEVLDGARAGRLSLLAPELLPAEIANIVCKRVFREGLRIDAARDLYMAFQRVCPELVGVAGLAGPALELALQHRHSVYDCLYVALAAGASCQMVTADEKLFKAIGTAFPQVRLLRDWA